MLIYLLLSWWTFLLNFDRTPLFYICIFGVLYIVPMHAHHSRLCKMAKQHEPVIISAMLTSQLGSESRLGLPWNLGGVWSINNIVFFTFIVICFIFSFLSSHYNF